MNQNDKLRMYEVPITFTMTGTVLVLAADPAKALDKVKEQFTDDQDTLDSAFESLVPDYSPVMKDGDPHSRLDFGRPTRSTANPRDYQTDFDEDEFALVDLNEKVEPEFPVSGEPSTAPKPTSRQNPPLSTPQRSPAPPPRGPAIGMRGTRDDNPPTAPESTAPKGGEPAQPQKTGAPTTATTSAGAVNPNVNKK